MALLRISTGGPMIRSVFVLLAIFEGSALAGDPFDTDGSDGSPPCVDHTDLVGYRRCPGYGAWGRNLLGPYVFLDLGMNMRHFPNDNRSISGSIARSTDPSVTTTK